MENAEVPKKMHIHKISNQKHIHFLNEQRKDPITGDLIVEGDEVVFCANCKSAFLKSSWEYMGKRHCESKRTLYIFPRAKELVISKIFSTNVLYYILSEDKTIIINRLAKSNTSLWKKEERTMSIPKSIKTEKENIRLTLENFNIDRSPVLNIILIISIIICLICFFIPNLTNEELNTIFFISVLVVAFPFIAAFFYPKLFFDTKKVKIQESTYAPVVFFERNRLCLYLHQEKANFYINYDKISSIKFYYPSSTHLRYFFYKLKIVTINGEEIELELKKSNGSKKYFLSKTESIIKLISKNSKDTLIIFKVSLQKSVFYQLNEMKNNVQNIRIE